MCRGMFNAGLGAAYLPDGNPINLHFVMFLPTLMGQGTPDQISDVRPNYCKKKIKWKNVILCTWRPANVLLTTASLWKLMEGSDKETQ